MNIATLICDCKIKAVKSPINIANMTVRGPRSANKLNMSAIILVSSLIALLVSVLIYVAFFKNSIRRYKGGNAVILCGPAGAGKTTLFLELATDEHLETIPSATTNTGNINKDVVVKDIPGSAQIRGNLLREALPFARSVVLVLDSSIGHMVDSDAVFVITLLGICAKNKLPLLIVANKEDLSGAGALANITREIDRQLARAKHWLDQGVNEDDCKNDEIEFLFNIFDDATRLSLAKLSSILDICSITASKNSSSSIEQINQWILSHY